MAKFHQLEIKDIRRETADCVSIAFDIPESLKDSFQYKQGQYITLKVKVGGEELRRSYSACSSPIADEELRIAVKKVENGRVSGHLNNGIEVGTSIEVMEPMGKFTTEFDQSKERHAVFYGGGSGITPLISIIRS